MEQGPSVLFATLLPAQGLSSENTQLDASMASSQVGHDPSQQSLCGPS